MIFGEMNKQEAIERRIAGIAASSEQPITNKRLVLYGNQEVRRNRSLQCFALLFAVHPKHAWQEQIDCDEL
jgi:hypothetical protein